MIKKKNRYILQHNGVELGQAINISGIAEILEISVPTIYATLTDDNTFKFRKKTYQIIDKLDLI